MKTTLDLDPIAMEAAFNAADEATPTGRAYAPAIKAAICAYLAKTSESAKPPKSAFYVVAEKAVFQFVVIPTPGAHRVHAGTTRVGPFENVSAAAEWLAVNWSPSHSYKIEEHTAP